MDMIWVPSETDAWDAVHMVGSDGKSVTVRMKNGAEVKIPGDASKFDPVTAEALEEDCENLVELESFGEGIILHHIRKRFLDGVIYTFVGNILIALNPYKPLPLYELPMIDKIFNLTKEEEALPPHVFSIGSLAVQNMKNDAKDQSILISGESGAGKTEATKRILQLISTVCASTASRVGASIENQILDSNPLLESFGNAKTIRNNNSSRFGKYMEINFNKMNKVKGCNVTAYLLEKSRVVKQGPKERNYHVFYMLLAGATKSMKNDLFLKPADQFHYLTQSGCLEVAGRSDANEFEEMMFAMNSLGIDITAQQQMFQCLAGVLHLGNLDFAASRDVDGGSKVTSPQDCRRAASLLGIQPDGLGNALCSRRNMIHGEQVIISLNPTQAVDQRDALAKYTYGKIFDEVVKRVNSSLFRSKPGNNIGVLDIFGFEVFKLNSFEQLCINYCNERLQTFFNEVIFEGEMKMYASEGLPCDDISYQDNMGCVRLIDLRGAGIFAYLDEEIVMPKGSDDKFVSKLNQVFDENTNTRSLYFSRNRRNPLEFAIRHFAGDVMYNAQTFMEKNKDALAEGLVELLQQSSISMLRATEEDSQGATAGTSGGGGGAKKKKGTKLTLAAKFKNDLDSLMTSLRATSPHFIRCIKPNDFQQHTKFDSNLVLNQLKYSGLFEAIRIRKAGYAVRMPIESFIRRYRHCAPNVPAALREDSNQYAHAMLVEMEKHVDYPALAEALVNHSMASVSALGSKSSSSSSAIAASKADRAALSRRASSRRSTRGSVIHRQWIVGNSKIFIRTLPYRQQLEKIRDKFKGNAAVPMQKVVRGFIMRMRVIKTLGVQRQAAETRRREEKEARAKEHESMTEEDRLSSAVENVVRSDVALQQRLAAAKAERIRAENEKNKEQRYAAAVQIQRIIRGKVRGKLGRIFMCERMLENALEQRDEQLINRAIQFPSLLGVSSKLIKVYQASAKTVILEVLSEAHVASELKEATEVGSVPLLRAAIRKAEAAHMPYLPELKTARRTLDNITQLHATLAKLDAVLAKCVTIPVLLDSIDQLQPLVQHASDLGLAGEFQVQDAALRMARIKNLVAVRDRLRFSVEICSPSKMKSAMKERTKLVRIYGPELLTAEARAVEGMFDMLTYQQHIDVSQLQTTAPASGGSRITSRSGGGTEDRYGSSAMAEAAALSMTELYAVISEPAVSAGEEAGAGALSRPAVVATDVYLPPFVRKVLDEMRDAQSQQNLSGAIERFVKLVPDELKRKFYIRIYKWVVAFASWKLPKTRHHQQSRSFSSVDDDVDGAEQGMTLGVGTETAGHRSQMTHSDSATPSPKRKGMGTAGGVSARSPAGRASPQTRLGQGSPSKPPAGGSRTLPPPPVAAAAGSPVYPTRKGSVFIPFAQRQAKSHVAAREILKKGSKHHHVQFTEKTDTLLKESIQEYDRFKATIQSPSTFKG